MMSDFFGAGGGDQLGERAAPDAGEREVNDIRVAKQVIKKRLDGFQRVGSSKLEQNYPQTPLGLRHPHRFPRKRPDVNSFQASTSNLALQIDARKPSLMRTATQSNSSIGRLCLIANTTSSTRVETPVLSKTLLKWCFTVSSAIPKRSAISLFARPETTPEMICNSRFVTP